MFEQIASSEASRLRTRVPLHTAAGRIQPGNKFLVRRHHRRFPRLPIPMSHKSRTESNDFTCVHCKSNVPIQAWGTRHRNHCPLCLWSRHVDDEPGDRACPCRSPMEPIGIEVRQDGEWAIIHRCAGCGTLGTNRVAGDDDERSLLALALRPIANPAFPLDGFRPSAS